MEQRLDATYLKAGPFERAAAVALAAAGAGGAILLASWGISFLWRYTPPEIAVHIANPVVHVAQMEPLTIKQPEPLVLSPPDRLKIEPVEVTVKAGQSPLPTFDQRESGAPVSSDIIRREVTVFSYVQHALGTVVTGWNYKDGSGGMPSGQFCYYTSANQDGSSRRVDLATNGAPRVQIRMSPVPDLAEALTKCQWWHPGQREL